MSKYKSFNLIREGVKIFKFQNQRSAVDLTHIMNSFREKRKGENAELLYAGRICFSVSSNGSYQKAYITKSKAKMLFDSIINGTFSKRFPTGFVDFGGGEKDGKVFSNKLEIKLTQFNNKDKIDIRIEEMPGKRTNTGAYKPIGKAHTTVNSMLDPNDLLEMAIETTDFIRAAEIAAMSNGIPMHTLTNIDFEKVNSTNSKNEENESNFQAMSGKEFYEYYLSLKNKFGLAQTEYNRRVEERDKQQQNQKAQ